MFLFPRLLCVLLLFNHVLGQGTCGHNGTLFDSKTQRWNLPPSASSFTCLDLSFMNLDTFPFELTQLRNLTYLNLAGTTLREVPASWSRLNKLRYLNLSANVLESLPLEWTALQALQYVDLSGNKLQALPAGWNDQNGWAELRWIDVSANRLSGPMFRMPGQLRGLDASSNQLTGTLPALPPSLGYLQLRYNKLRDASNVWSKNLIYLTLDNNELKRSTFLFSLLQLPSLMYLNIASNGLTGTLPPTVSSPLVYCNLGNNALYGTLPYSWAERSWAYLDLSNNRLTGRLPSTWPASVSFLFLQGNQFIGCPTASWNSPTDLIAVAFGGNDFRSCRHWPTTWHNTLKKLRLLDLANCGLPPTVPSSWLEGSFHPYTVLHLGAAVWEQTVMRNETLQMAVCSREDTSKTALAKKLIYQFVAMVREPIQAKVPMQEACEKRVVVVLQAAIQPVVWRNRTIDFMDFFRNNSSRPGNDLSSAGGAGSFAFDVVCEVLMESFTKRINGQEIAMSELANNMCRYPFAVWLVVTQWSCVMVMLAVASIMYLSEKRHGWMRVLNFKLQGCWNRIVQAISCKKAQPNLATTAAHEPGPHPTCPPPGSTPGGSKKSAVIGWAMIIKYLIQLLLYWYDIASDLLLLSQVWGNWPFLLLLPFFMLHYCVAAGLMTWRSKTTRHYSTLGKLGIAALRMPFIPFKDTVMLVELGMQSWGRGITPAVQERMENWVKLLDMRVVWEMLLEAVPTAILQSAVFVIGNRPNNGFFLGLRTYLMSAIGSCCQITSVVVEVVYVALKEGVSPFAVLRKMVLYADDKGEGEKGEF